MAFPAISGGIRMKKDFRALEKMMRRDPEAFFIAMSRAAVQMLNWCNLGSARDSRKPPIRWGVLRGSSSAFIGNKLIGTFPQAISPGAGESPTPAVSHQAKPTVLTFVWNTDYATKMHEWKGGWGDFTIQDGDAGNKWLERHLQADKNDLMKLISTEFKKEAGL